MASLETDFVTSPAQVVTPKSPPWREILVFSFLPFLIAIFFTFGYTPDDVFITLRYAVNFVHGYGLVFNQGQHVQGFTSPLDLAVAIVVYLIPGGFVLLKMKLVSVLFGLLAVREATYILWESRIPRWAFRFGCMLIGACPVIAFASVNALETTLEAWLLLALTRRLINRGEDANTVVLGMLSFLAVLARPDALAPIALLAVTCLFLHRAIPLVRRISWLVGAGISALGTLAFEWLYFGSVLPNTYYAKELPLGRSLDLGSRYIFRILEPIFFGREFKLVLVANVMLCTAGVYSIVRRRHRYIFLIALFIGQALFILKAGGDYMLEERFLAVSEVPFLITEIFGLLLIVAFFRERIPDAAARTPSVVLVIVVTLVAVLPFRYINVPAWRIHGLRDAAILKANPDSTVSTLWTALPSLLHCVQPGQLVATTEIGFFGYTEPQVRILDLRGLTNRAIALGAPSAVKETWGVLDPYWYRRTSPVGRVLLEQRPTVIVEFDTLPMSKVLGGLYHLVRVKTYDQYPVSFYVPKSATSICNAARE